MDFSLIRDQALQSLEQHGFSRSIWSNYREAVPGMYLETQLPKNYPVPERNSEISNRK
jgi:hypothetical protein